MKKMLLLLASLACFGLLASCSDETQDFNDVNVSKEYFYVGNVTGNIILSNNNTATFPTSNIATVKYTKDPKSNTIGYTLTVQYTKKGDQDATGATITITKIGNKYYDCNNNYADVTVAGSLEDSNFTINTIKGKEGDSKSTSDNLPTFSNLKFTRA